MIQKQLSRGGILLRTLLTVMTPLLAVVIALGYHFTTANMEAAQNAINERGDTLAKHLAALSEFDLFTENIDALKRVTSSILDEPGVVHVTIKNRSGSTLISTAHESRTYKQEDLATFEAPAIRTGVNVTDYIGEDDELSGETANKIIGSVTVSLSTEDTTRKQKDILISGTMITILGLLLSFLLALFVARSVTQPIMQLKHVVDRLTSGDLASRTHEGSPGELGTLEHGINLMASTLEESQNNLVKEVDEATRMLQATVNELELRNTELSLAKVEAERAGSAKAEFLASMSHEIRTPLSAVIGYSQLLEKMEQTEEQHEYTRTITQAASQLLVIIDDILRFTRLDSGVPELDKSIINLHERFENIVTIQAAAAYEKQIELVLLIHSDVPVQIYSDANRIGEVLTNLIANAIKFTGQGHIIIEALLGESGPEGDIIEVSVTDTGIGMSRDEAERVFRPFTQADASTSRKYGGTGLGLAISKQLVELIGGDIGVTSEPGMGSRFWFTIPTAHIETNDTQISQLLSGIRVLVYDQNTFSRRAIRIRLLGWGASVFNSGRWTEMLGMLDSARREGKPYDFLVLGLSVQEYGRRLVTEILEDVRHSNDIPILLLIGSEAQHLSSGNLDLKRVKLVSKPPRADRMLRAIQALLPAGGAAEPASWAARHPDSSAADGKLAGLKVLVAEDNEFNQGLIRRLLEQRGVSVTLAADGEQACTRATETLFDLIFMDIHMPEIGGIEASQFIRDGINRNTPIIALSADVFVREDQLDGGLIQACITKPVSERKLAEILRKWASPGNTSAGQINRNGTCQEESPLSADMQQQLHAELAAQLADLRAACQAADDSVIRDHLHQIKGLTDYFQLGDFRTGCDSLYQAAAEGDRPGMIAALDRLDAMLASRSE